MNQISRTTKSHNIFCLLLLYRKETDVAYHEYNKKNQFIEKSFRKTVRFFHSKPYE